MSKIKVVIRLKQEESDKITDATKPDEPCRDSNGQFVPIDQLSFMKLNGSTQLKKRSINTYIASIVKINVDLEKYGYLHNSDKNMFYWEKYCEDEVMIAIVRILHEHHKISGIADVRQKIVPIMTCLNMIKEVPASDIVKWVNFKDRLSSTEYYDNFCDNHDINQRKKDTARSEREIPEWEKLHARFTKISETGGFDINVRLICALYKNGYVMRSGVLFNTRLDGPREGSNYLNLETGVWEINETKSGRDQVLELPEELMSEMRDMLPKAERKWLLCRNNGNRYTYNLSAIPQWRQLRLGDNTLIRKSYERWQWLKSGDDVTTVRERSLALDHGVGIAIRNYVGKGDDPSNHR